MVDRNSQTGRFVRSDEMPVEERRHRVLDAEKDRIMQESVEQSSRRWGRRDIKASVSPYSSRLLGGSPAPDEDEGQAADGAS